MRYDQIDSGLRASVMRQIGLALAIGLGVFGAMIAVAAMVQISGAVVGSGKLIVEGRSKQVQHLDGGTVREILVSEGSQVRAGQILFAMDPTAIRASLDIVTGQIATLTAQQARLEAELAGRDRIAFPVGLTGADDPETRALMAGQQDLLAARTDARASRLRHLDQQIGQLTDKIAALGAQRAAAGDSLALAELELADAQSLRDKNLSRLSELRATMRARLDLMSALAGLDAQIIEARQEITVTELERTRIVEDFRAEALAEIDDRRAQLAQLDEERIAAQDRLDRLQIRAPQSGYVHELTVNTTGQVLAPGEVLMTIVPGDDHLIAEMRTSPQDVDQVYPGQTARLRFVGLDQRTTPEVAAKVIGISPDSSTDPTTAETYFLTRLRIDPQDLERLAGQTLMPGMQTEIFISTQSRTIMSYLARPLTDQIQHAFREN